MMEVNIIRKKLLGIGFIWKINAAWKCNRIKRAYKWTRNYYAKKEKVDFDLSKESIDYLDQLTEKLSVLWIGTNDGQDYSGLLQGLSKVANVEVFQREDGEYGQLPALGSNAEYDRKKNGQLLIDLAWNSQRGKPKVDLIIGQMWAYRMDPQALDQVRSYGIPVVNISMDDRHAYHGKRRSDGTWGGTRGLIGHIDFSCSAAKECVDWYQKEGCPALYLPEASDPDFFHPVTGITKKYDVGFVGMRYGIRDRIISELKQAGLIVKAYGQGWVDGHIKAKEVPGFFAQSKIVLGIGTINYCNDFYSLKMRDFDGPMSGSFYLTHANPDLYELYNIGDEIAVYNDISDCVKKAKYYCNHDNERERIAWNGRIRAFKDHTWEIRFKKIINTVLNLKANRNLSTYTNSLISSDRIMDRNS